MTEETPKIHVDDPEASDYLSREWLVTNGLGGYASGTVAGVLTRRYHGLLIAGLPNPLGRTMMLNGIAETLSLSREKESFSAGTTELMGLHHDDAALPNDFKLENGLPVWTYRFEDHLVEKRIFMDHHYNTVHVSYSLRHGKEPLNIELRPGVSFRPHDSPVHTRNEVSCCVKVKEGEIEMTNEGYPPLRILSEPAVEFVGDRKVIDDVLYRVEASRGYDSEGSLWSPGYFQATMAPGETLTLTATAEPIEGEQISQTDPHLALEAERRNKLLERASESLLNYPASELLYAADQFVIVAPRVELKRQEVGDERTVIAGYHWFTDWGRDTMISLEGLTLVAGKPREGRAILKTFAQHVKHGLIPNMFPEGESEGLYHTADATLWFFHAISRYEKYTGDKSLVQELFPTLKGIIEAHVRGTLFGIHVDPADQLLSQGAQGYQLTWMDAKVGDWVVTPRRGKAVEINALWYNALMWMAEWAKREEAAVEREEYALRAEAMRKSFNQRFWYAEGGYLYDVVDAETGGNDSACRPNQVFAISLPYAVLDEDKWAPVMSKVDDKLLTPVGLRSLSPDHPNYSAKYFGDLRSRDAAYHQGTVWAWLIGPYIDAWLRLHPGQETKARVFLEGFVPHLNQACVGSISEIFDAEAPHTPRGCIAQAWSVAEVLRCWQLTSAIPEEMRVTAMSGKSR